MAKLERLMDQRMILVIIMSVELLCARTMLNEQIRRHRNVIVPRGNANIQTTIHHHVLTVTQDVPQFMFKRLNIYWMEILNF